MGEREGNINVWLPLTHPQLVTLPRNPGMYPGDPLVCRLVLNPLSHTKQGCFNKILTVDYAQIVAILFKRK